MMTEGIKSKSLKASDFIHMQQQYAEQKILLLAQEKNMNKNRDTENNDENLENLDEMNELHKNTIAQSVDFFYELEKVVKTSRDRMFIDNAIHELEYYKLLSRKVMVDGDTDNTSSKAAKNFLQSIEQAQTLLERLWKFYA